MSDFNNYLVDLVFTGQFRDVPRKTLTELAESRPVVKVRSSVAKSRTNLLVASAHAIEANSTKVQKARALGIQIISYGEFLMWFTQPTLDRHGVGRPVPVDFHNAMKELA